MNLDCNSLADVGKLDRGGVDDRYRETIAAVINDCMRHPAAGKPRQVRITVNILPVVGQDGRLRELRTWVLIDPAKLVQFASNTYPMIPNVSNTGELIGLTYNDAHGPEDSAYQGVLPIEQEGQ